MAWMTLGEALGMYNAEVFPFGALMDMNPTSLESGTEVLKDSSLVMKFKRHEVTVISSKGYI